MADYISREAAKEFFLNMDAGSRCPSSTLLTPEAITHWMPLPEPPEEGGEGNAAL